MKNIMKLIGAALLGAFLAGCGGLFQDENAAGPYDRANILLKVSSAAPLADVDALVPGTRLKVVASFENYTCLLYRTDGSEPVDKTVGRLSHDPLIAVAEKEEPYRLFLVPNDPLYAAQQWAPKLTGCETAWDDYTGDPSVIVAVIDSGVNGAHQDFGSGRVIAGYNTAAGSPIAAGTNSDVIGHGTHVAGIIGAAGNNSLGVAGVAWNCRIMPVRVADASGNIYTSSIVAAIIWATDNGADVINMSLGSLAYSQVMADAVDYALSNSVTVVAAMGNDSMAAIEYPAGYPGVIAVGSTNGRDEISAFSTTGNHISVSAPGESILSLSYSSNGAYVYMNGTSMASPFVAGVAALLLGRDPTFTPAEVRSILEDSAADLGAGGFDPVFGYGRVNVGAALALAERDNYGRVRAQVSFNTAALGGVEVLVMNAAGTQTLRTALTSNGANGGTTGEADFRALRAGNYRLSARVNGTTQTQDITVAAGGEQTVIFAFTAAGSYNCVIETFPNGGEATDPADTIIDLYNASLTLIESDDDDGYNTYSRISRALTSGAAYYIRVTGWSSSTTGYYSILVNLSGGGSSATTPAQTAGEDDDNDAQAVPMTFGVVYDRYLSAGDYDWFRIVMP